MARRVAHPSVDDRKAKGLEARDHALPSGHTGWKPATDRPDPVDLLVEQETTREPDLVPVRHGRMMVSPFTFPRGAAKIMAADLAATPVAGLEAQLCGDAHLSNFGSFASPERRLLFDVDDFDETLPGPFEYDVKRMAASFTIAARNNGFSPADTRAATLESVRAYRAAMASFAQMGTMDIWYAHLDEDDLRTGIRNAVAGASGQEKADRREEKTAKAAEKRAEKRLGKAHTRDSHQALSKLCEVIDGKYQIVSQPPVVIPGRDLAATYGISAAGVIPQGQLMMQAASDIYLGWPKGLDVKRHYYWRQLRGMKGSAIVEAMVPLGLNYYAQICGWTLARAHARSGDPVAIAEYLGETDAFDKSITDFAQRYADQNEQDYGEFVDAVKSGRLEAHEGI